MWIYDKLEGKAQFTSFCTDKIKLAESFPDAQFYTVATNIPHLRKPKAKITMIKLHM